jgi:hypothetical protein
MNVYRAWREGFFFAFIQSFANTEGVQDRRGIRIIITFLVEKRQKGVEKIGLGWVGENGNDFCQSELGCLCVAPCFSHVYAVSLFPTKGSNSSLMIIQTCLLIFLCVDFGRFSN